MLGNNLLLLGSKEFLLSKNLLRPSNKRFLLGRSLCVPTENLLLPRRRTLPGRKSCLSAGRRRLTQSCKQESCQLSMFFIGAMNMMPN
uniref:hypothetical protein n=1 Tax=Candidatus Electronema sp. TaxID=2698783 RepID=UPI004057951A